MRKLLLLFLTLIPGLIFGEKAVEQGSETTQVTMEKPKVVLTKEQKVSKSSAEKLVKIFENWDLEKDYDILFPRISEYVDDYFNSWRQPVERGLEDNKDLLEIYKKLPLNKIKSISLREIVEGEIERAKAIVEGKYTNPAFPSYLTSSEQTFTEDILKQFKANPELRSFHDELAPIYKNLKRLSLDYKMMKDKVASETSRMVDKRLNDYYINDELEEEIKDIANNLGNYVREREPELVSNNQKIVKEFEAKKDLLKEKYKSENNDDKLRATYKEEYFVALKAYKSAKNVGIDQILESEVNRLYRVFGQYLPKMPDFAISDNLIKKIRDKESDAGIDYKKSLKSKFYSPLISKFQLYFKFNVTSGFRYYRVNVLVLSFLFFILFFFITFFVRKKKGDLYIRKIPGLDAIDDAIGRATEMGKPIFYDSGISPITDPQTIASMLILKNISKKVAEFKAEIYFPSFDPVVMQVADEMISTGYMDAGFPEDYKKDNVFFLTNDQFAYASGLSGLTARKKPASCFHFGAYAAESLLISEAGFAAGAIQVAGTVQSTQLPFFIAACDHTLIGEELYAAAAYLSRDPMIVSNLKISDYSKVILGVLFLIATTLLTINSEWTFLREILESR